MTVVRADSLASDPERRGAGPEREHFVHFYEQDEVLLEGLEEFVRRALESGAAAVVVATRGHRAALDQRLQSRGLDLATLRQRGQYATADAEETLSRLLVDGWPQSALFAEFVEPLIAAAARHGRVVAFGEMVSLLFGQKRYGAAVQLEQLWNDLGQRQPITLYCAYRLPAGGQLPGGVVERVCLEHERVVAVDGAGGRSAPGRGADGASHLAGRPRDIERENQQRRAIEQALARREHELTDFLEHVPCALQSLGPDGRILWANRVELELLGRSREELTGLSFRDVLADESASVEVLARLLAGESVREAIVKVRHRDGSLRRVVLDASPLWDEERFVHSRCSLRDVTMAEEAERLRALLASIVESSDDAIVSKTLEGRVSSWNSGAERIFGWTAAEMVGRPITTIIPPDLQDEEPLILSRLRRGERLDHFETTRLTKDGRRIPVSLTVSPVRDASGRVVGVSKVARDITERRRAEESLREADRRKDEFLAMLGHELRNPLAPIRNVLEVLRHAPSADPLLAEMCRILDRQVGHMTKLLDDLLDVSRITHGKIQFQRETLELQSVVTRAVETSRPILDERRHRLELVLPEEPLRVTGDMTRLVQAVSNLLNNAAKYTPEGGTITVTVRAEGGRAELSVRDTGVGMAAELLPRVFDLFVQADRTLERAQGGLGLGLSLVRRIVEAHDGSVEARSAGPGRGSEFLLRLPLLEASARATVGERDAAPELAASPRKRRVLIVDDNRDAGESMGLLLKMAGHEVLAVTEPGAALEVVDAFDPHLVLLDIGLPGMSGYDLGRLLRERGCRAMLAAVTGYGQADDRRRSVEAGFEHHFVKPVDPAKLARLLE